jgi:endonuclease/exonuclease/phosphatase family metal-dependent hydrolase
MKVGLKTLVALLGLVAACGGGAPKPGLPVKVLTWNLYLGSSLEGLITAKSPAEVPPVAAGLLAEVQASNFPSRAKVIAARIAELAPDLVALQEVSLYRRQSPGDYAAGAPPNATEALLDFLALVMAELDARGGGYRVVLEAPNTDNELPVDDGAGGLFDLRFTDRDVILARDGVTTSDAAQVVYKAKFNFVSGGAGGVPLQFGRSVSHAGADVGGAAFTFANTHLEVGALEVVQVEQAKEMLAALDDKALPGPMLLLGDFNSPPGGDSYELIRKSFRDQAAGLPAPASDPTCCNAGDLKNDLPQPGNRIDLVWTRGAFRMTSARIIGNDPAADKTPEGLWPSDHFGVYAELELAK